MSDEKNTPERREFEPDAVKGRDAQLFECMKCGATLSASSRFCQVCGHELSGGGWDYPGELPE